jgi:hypothetical protein
MRPTTRIIPALILFVGVLATASSWAGSFSTSCGPLPFKPIAQAHPIDQSCGIDGVFDTAAHQAQNHAKNNFCAQGEPLTLSLDQFVDLQTAAEEAGVTFGGRNTLPEDRSVLGGLIEDGRGGRLGEGRLVRIAAFVIDAKNSNTSKGESVNCQKKGAANNDIHISLGKHADDDLCNSVTAEITPHFRPATWNKDNLNNLTRPVRITGQLFFDASHKPCHDGSGAPPQRMSIWEIHPVYAVDVCKNKKLSSCDPDDSTNWEPLHKWADRQADPEEH